MDNRIQEALEALAGRGYKMELLRQDGSIWYFHKFDPPLPSPQGGKLISCEVGIAPEALDDPNFDLEGALMALWDNDGR